MLKKNPPININEADIVNLRQEADQVEMAPEKMLALVDLIFGFQEDRWPPS